MCKYNIVGIAIRLFDKNVNDTYYNGKLKFGNLFIAVNISPSIIIKTF